MVLGGEEAWGGDIALTIESAIETSSSMVYKAVSSWQGRNLGLIVSIPKQHGEKGFGQNFEIQSIGKESDYLLTIMGQIWDQKVSKTSRFVTKIALTYVNLNEFAKSLGPNYKTNNPYAGYKLFFEGAKDVDYAELYVNINHSENLLEIKEKDSGYRKPIIRWLKG